MPRNVACISTLSSPFNLKKDIENCIVDHSRVANAFIFGSKAITSKRGIMKQKNSILAA